MRTNATKVKLGEGKVVFGAIIARFAPDLVELFGAIGFDFVMIDCEHGPMDLDQVEHMVRAARYHTHRPYPGPQRPDHFAFPRPGSSGHHRASCEYAR